MAGVIFKLIGLVIVLGGVICVYDARLMTINWFSFGDQNEATAGFKILGTIVAIVGAFIIYWSVGT